MSGQGRTPAALRFLVIASDPNIETLIGQLIEFAGHRVLYDATSGAAGEAIRRARPDVVLLNTALECPVVQACLDAAEEVACVAILTSSTASDTELASDAAARRYPHFALPGGPRALASLIARSLGEARAHPREALPAQHPTPSGDARAS